MKKLDLTAARAAPPSEHNNDDDLMEQLASPRCVSSGAVEGVMFVYQKGAGLLEPSWKKRYCIVPPNDHHIMIYRLVRATLDRATYHAPSPSISLADSRSRS